MNVLQHSMCRRFLGCIPVIVGDIDTVFVLYNNQFLLDGNCISGKRSCIDFLLNYIQNALRMYDS